METTITTYLAQDELQDLDQFRRGQGVSRAEAVRDAVRWYIRWGDRLPIDDPAADEIEL